MKHGSVIVKGGRVISTGVNKERSHPRIVSSEHIKDHCSVHAEVDAIKKAKSVSGATIYVARVNKRGAARDSRPCKRCFEAIKSNGIKKIIYTTSEE
jgi:deoxycytidylate deaminase